MGRFEICAGGTSGFGGVSASLRSVASFHGASNSSSVNKSKTCFKVDVAGEKPWHDGCPIKCTYHILYKSPSLNCQSDIKIQVGHLGVINKSTH